MIFIQKRIVTGNRGQIRYECKCDCGNSHIASGESIRSWKSKSCGCNRKNPPNKENNRKIAIWKQLYKSTDGKTISNTYGLEKDYGWTGIVAEANPIYKDALIANRSCSIYLGAVYSHDDGVKFNMTVASDLSTISGYGTDDEHAINRLSGNLINVETCTLRQLLERNDTPTYRLYIYRHRGQ